MAQSLIQKAHEDMIKIMKLKKIHNDIVARNSSGSAKEFYLLVKVNKKWTHTEEKSTERTDKSH